MIRRQFIKLATLTGATGLTSLGAFDALEKKASERATDAKEIKTVLWRIQGFTCITCAVGLEVMLRQQKGVKSADASYPGATVTIQFHPEEVSEASLRSFITGIGFTADEQKG
jgi:anaerobic selenocysteine-containing dehydrogenase